MIEKGVWIAAVFVAAIAGWMDWRYRRIPNWLTVPGLLAGIVGNTLASGWSGAKASLLGAGLGLALLLPFVLVRSLGAGDWKVVGAVGALVGPGPLITVLVAAIFVASIMAVLLIVYKRRVRQALRNVGRILAGLFSLGLPGPDLSLDSPESLKIPFGVAVALTVVFYGVRRALGGL